MGFFKVLGAVVDVAGMILGAGFDATSTQVSSQAKRNKNLTDEQREAMYNFADAASTMSYTVRDGLSNLGNSIKERDTQNGAYYACEDYGDYDDDESKEYFDESYDDDFE